MYRRRARAHIVQREVRLGELRLDISDHDAADGTLRTLENLRPAGPVGTPYYTPVAPRIDHSNALGAVVAIGEYVTDDDTTELIIVTSASVYKVDPTTFSKTLLYTFSATDTTRKAQFATVGITLFIASSVGTGTGAPEILLRYDGSTIEVVANPVVEPRIVFRIARAFFGASFRFRIRWHPSVIVVEASRNADVERRFVSFFSDRDRFRFRPGSVHRSARFGIKRFRTSVHLGRARPHDRSRFREGHLLCEAVQQAAQEDGSRTHLHRQSGVRSEYATAQSVLAHAARAPILHSGFQKARSLETHCRMVRRLLCRAKHVPQPVVELFRRDAGSSPTKHRI